jgi:PAS domain S-box-containing protein
VSNTWSKILPVLFARFVAVLCALVLVAWIARVPELIRINENFAPMQFNTALVLLFSALGILFLHSSQKRLAWIFGGTVLFVGSLTFLQYMLGTSFGIDELFMKSYLPTVPAHPGRMASNSALCMMLLGGGVIILSRQKSRRMGQIPIFLGVSVTAFAVLALFSFIVKLPVQYGWGNFSSMSLQAAVSLILLGLGIALTAGSIGTDEELSVQDFIPTLVAISILTGAVAIWQIALWNEAREVNHTTFGKGEAVRIQLLDGLEDRIKSIERMGNRLEFKTPPTKEAWEADANHYIAHLGILDTFAVIDQHYRVKWVYPEGENLRFLNLDMSKDPVRAKTIDRAKETHEPELTPIVELKAGGRGFIIYIPLFRNAIYSGVLAASIRPMNFVNQVIQSPGYEISIKSGDEVLYANREHQNKDLSTLWSVSLPVNLHGNNLTLSIAPNLATIRENESAIPYVILFTGVFAALILGILAQLAITARRQSIIIGEQKNVVDGVIKSSPLAILVLGKDHRVQLWNSACERIFGWTAAEAIGKFLPFVPPELMEQSHVLAEQILKSGEQVDAEAIRMTRAGRRIPVRIYARALHDDRGESYGLMALVEDVTERKRAEQEIKDAREVAEKAVEVKSQFLANMSHEIRTPLNGIIGMADLLLMTTLNEDQKRYSKIIQNSGTSLLTLINDILDFSKIEAGKLQLENLDFSLVSLVETQAELMVARARKKNLVLTTYISPDLPAIVRGDPGRIAQIILNLLGNAIKFTESGSVSVSAVEAKRNPDETGPVRIRFEISDTGIGLSQYSAQKLFQPFSQVDGSTARKYGGTGLGLSISKNIVVAMAGEIGIESVVGQGSTFWFEIDLNQIEKSTLTPVQRKVLVVDNDKASSETILRYLSAWQMEGRRVDQCSDAIAVLDAAHKAGNPYQVILVGKSCETIIPELPGTRARIILMTEFEDMVPTIQDKRLSGRLSKPIKQSELYDHIAEAQVATLQNPPENPNRPEVKKDARILVADDVAANRLLTVKFLEYLGYQALAVANGKEVLQQIEESHFDLILMDCQMPEMDGFEATRLIRLLKNEKLRSIPIVALTANAMGGDDQKCLDAGMDDYLSKPFKKERLGEIVSKWLKTNAV